MGRLETHAAALHRIMGVTLTVRWFKVVGNVPDVLAGE
jgi:hypothetical protein